MTGRKDGETLFHRTLPATAMSPTSTTAVDLRFKVEDIEYDLGLTKNYYSQHSKNQLNS